MKTRRQKWKTERQSIPMLERLCYKPAKPAAFVGAKRFVGAARVKGIKPSVARKWLESQVPYTLHKAVRKQFERSRVVVNGMDEQWQADLVDEQAL